MVIVRGRQTELQDWIGWYIEILSLEEIAINYIIFYVPNMLPNSVAEWVRA